MKFYILCVNNGGNKMLGKIFKIVSYHIAKWQPILLKSGVSNFTKPVAK